MATNAERIEAATEGIENAKDVAEAASQVMDDFTRGDDDQDVTNQDGEVFPSLQKWLKENQDKVDMIVLQVKASQAEAEAGLEDTKYMTPLMTNYAIQALTPPSFEAGMMMFEGRSTPREGWIYATGTIGNGTNTTATQRRNDDCEFLFKYLWENFADAQAPVFGGRGASADDDWLDNTKTIQIPEVDGKTLAVLNSMPLVASGGNSSTANGLDAFADTVGASGGKKDHQLQIGEMPSHNHTTNTLYLPDHKHNTDCVYGVDPGKTAEGTADNDPFPPDDTLSMNPTTNPALTGGTDNRGGNGNHNNTQPTTAMYLYIKL